jgi:hypothetical protein
VYKCVTLPPRERSKCNKAEGGRTRTCEPSSQKIFEDFTSGRKFWPESERRKYRNFSFTGLSHYHRKFAVHIILRKTTHSCRKVSVHIILTEILHFHRKISVPNILVDDFLQRLSLQKDVCLLSSQVWITIFRAYYSFRKF